jgi:hypothetical protein
MIEANKMSTLDDKEVYEPSPIILSVFGYTNKISEDDIYVNTLTPILSEIGRPPDKILIPSDGNSSIYIQSWAESLRIKTQIFQADWQRNGRMAQILRDDRMSKECTHALVFLSAKSQRLERFAERMARKGKNVFTSSHNQTLTQYEMSHCEPAPLPRASERARKSDIGKGQTLLKFRTTEGC